MRSMRSLAGLVVLGATALLTACGGGGGGGGDAQVRTVNATVGIASIDTYATDTKIAEGVLNNTVGTYNAVGEGSYVLKITNTGSTTSIASAAPTFSAGNNYTVVAIGQAGATQVVYFTDNEPAPATGNAKLRVYNTSPDAGSLDLYLTDATTDLSVATPVISATPITRVSGYSELTAGTYRLRVTAAGSKTDVRLDIAAVTLTDQNIATMILQPSPGGLLVQGLSLLQGGAVTAYANTSARVRAVASVAGSGSVTAAVGGVPVTAGLVSPVVSSSYVLVPAGSQTLNLQVGGTTLPAATVTLAPGGDYTVLAYGANGSPQYTLLADDNRAPTNTAAAKVRLVNGLQSGAGNLALSVNFSSLATNIGSGSASAYGQVTAGTTASLIQVSSTNGTTLYTSPSNSPPLTAGKVYTIFVLDGASSPQGIPSLDTP